MLLISTGIDMNILKLPIEQAVPGMVTADDVYTFNNQLIITKGTTLTDRIITHLNFYAVPYVKIEVPDSKPASSEANMEEPSFINEPYSEKVKGSTEFKQFKKSFINMIDPFKNQLNSMILDNSNEVNTNKLLSEVDSILEHTRNGLHVFDMLHCMRDADDLTYVHSVNVALICNVMGKWLKFDNRDLETVTLSGLLHDIGKLEMPAEILKKPGKLNDAEYEKIKMHTLKGYNILKKKNLNIHVQMSAMMHHERNDGSGYPMGIRGVQIDKMAKIVMIADIYDAMTSARVYRGPMCPFEVLSIYESEGLSHFDTKYIMTFMEYIRETYLGNTVRLNDNSIGKIIMMNRNNITKPVIQLKDGFVDLTKEQNLYIEAML